MKVAIIGAGVSGLMVANQLDGVADYTLFESNSKLGGHADTQDVVIGGQRVSVDTGFIVFNRDVYTHFNGMLETLGVDSIPTDMSFAVTNRESGLEYNATSIPTLFCQKRNWFNPRFYRMIWDIRRFYQAAEGLLKSNNKQTIHEYLTENNYSRYFIDEHIIPMASALWSGDFVAIREYPVVYMLQFMKNHQMLQLDNRPQWRTIKGGSKHYVQAIKNQMQGELQLNTPVLEVKRHDHQVDVITAKQTHTFDAVVFATHTDITQRLLGDSSVEEDQALSDIPYVENHMDLHTDAAIMPANKKAWASWHVNKYPESTACCTVNYYMNLLQSLDCKEPVIVSLNQNKYLDPDKILLSKKYHHPVYNQNTLRAQNKLNELQGKNNTYYCGAYMGWGFHEDGARSGVQVAEAIKAKLT